MASSYRSRTISTYRHKESPLDVSSGMTGSSLHNTDPKLLIRGPSISWETKSTTRYKACSWDEGLQSTKFLGMEVLRLTARVEEPVEEEARFLVIQHDGHDRHEWTKEQRSPRCRALTIGLPRDKLWQIEML